MRVEDLERELRAQRSQVDHDFARRLDEWAEAGFPRDRGLGPALERKRGGFQRLWDRLTAVPPRRVALPVGAVATVAVIVGVAIGNSGNDTGHLSAGSDSLTTAAPAPSAEDSGGAAAQSESAAPSAGAGAAAAPDAGASPEFQLEAPPAADTARARRATTESSTRRPGSPSAPTPTRSRRSPTESSR